MQLLATQTAAAVRGGELTARQATEAALDRIARTQPTVNAWQVVRAEAALAEADAVDARPDLAELPLAGVPVAIKDNIPVSGEPMRDGSAGSEPAPQAADHVLVRRLREAGAVVVGLARVPELCLYGATDSVYGITRNPWDLDRTPGGSSGGSAAAVASGAVPVAHGNDGLGSIRIPAACCGLVGIKPGAGVVPREYALDDSWFGLSENGPLATSVGDAALMLSVLAADPSYAEPREPAPLRIAVSTRTPAPGGWVAREWSGAARSVADLLGREGHDVREAGPAYPLSLIPTAMALWATIAAQGVDHLADPASIEARNRRHAALGRRLARRGHPKPESRDRWRVSAEEFFEDVDVLLTPTLAQPPIRARAWSQGGLARTIVSNALYAPFAAPWNLIGWPAMSVPAGLDRHGRPLAVQLVGRPGTESTLLGLALQLERIRPWRRTAPLAEE